MSVKIEVKGKAWPEKYQKLLDRAEELTSDSDLEQACVWKLLGAIADARGEELHGERVDNRLAALNFAVEMLLGDGQCAAQTPEPAATANPAEEISRESMRKAGEKADEASKCMQELRDAEEEWSALLPELVNSDAEKEAWTRLVTADERMRRTRSQLRRAAKIAMGYITE